MPAKSRLLDVNVLAIYLVEDHPGHAYVAAALDEGLAGRTRLLAPDMLPLRARWVLTARWGIPKPQADAVLRSFLDHPRVAYVGASRAALARAMTSTTRSTWRWPRSTRSTASSPPTRG